MLRDGRHALLILLLMLTCSAVTWAQAGLNPAGKPRYGRRTLAPGFAPSPLTIEVVSGGDVAVKPLALGDNCLGYAAADPDAVLDLAAGFERVTILSASAARHHADHQLAQWQLVLQ